MELKDEVGSKIIYDFFSEDSNIYEEEKKNLDKNLQQIDSMISEYEGTLEIINNEMEGYINDYEFIEHYKELRAKYSSIVEPTQRLRIIVKSPYFGHMILDSNYGEEDLFIGEESVYHNGDYIIYDWRSPICSLFYANQTYYKYNDYNYNVISKRKLIIANRELKYCTEEYNNNKRDDVTDSFLIKILKQKKNINGFTDIIKSIQSKQNEIIRSDLEQNIICQGVAGSGKTVIILHRLSYLLFNNPSIYPEKFLYIAPNDDFKKELSKLNQKLQIDKIKVMTITEYYIEKLNDFFRFIGVKIDKRKIIDDNFINTEYLYSDDYLEPKYNLVSREIFKTIKNIKKKYDIKVEESSCYETIKSILIYFNNIRLKLDNLRENIKNNFDVSKVPSLLEKLQKNYEIVEKNNFDLKREIAQIEQALNNVKFKFLRRFSSSYQEQQNRVLLKKQKIERNDYKLEEITSNIKILDKVGKIKSITEIILEKIKKLHNEIEEDYGKLQIFVKPSKIIEIIFEKLYANQNIFEGRFKYNRSDIFLILYIFAKFGFPNLDNYKYIYVDESQDYYDDEIKLIMSVEKNPILNIFGDINQNISKNRILRKDWSRLKEILPKCSYFELNENYRNTKNIVDYCNKNIIKNNMIAIGPSGEDVIIKKFTDISSIINNARDIEAVIIAKNADFINRIKENYSNVFSILEAKGLEFKSVIVIDDGLDNNEKYVACTRALSVLIIYEV